MSALAADGPSGVGPAKVDAGNGHLSTDAVVFIILVVAISLRLIVSYLAKRRRSRDKDSD
jgi:hypothetical protein